jgi:hypothetical protein
VRRVFDEHPMRASPRGGRDSELEKAWMIAAEIEA